MKKIISVLLCVVILFSVFSFSAFAAKDDDKTKETTEFVLEIDVNNRYTNFANDADAVQEQNEKEADGKKTVYIAVLCAALVVSVVILAVSLKKVPKEEDVDISGQNKIQKDKEE